MRKSIKGVSLITLLVTFMASICCLIASHTGSAEIASGTFKTKDTQGTKSVMLTHSRPHGAEGAVIEFDLIGNPSKTESAESENNRFRFFAGMVEDKICGTSTLAGTGLQAAGVAIDALTNKITYYPNGLCYGAAATFTGTAENTVTALDTWNYQTDSALFIGGNTYRLIYDFTPSDFTDSLVLQSKPTGGTAEYETLLTVNNLVDPFTGANHANTPAVNKTGKGYAGILFEDLNAEIDNFNVYEKDGRVIAKESFNGGFSATAAGKVNYGGAVVSAYTRSGPYGLMGVEQDVGTADLTVDGALVEAGISGADGIGGTITLKNKEITYNSAAGAFNPYAQITSIVDETSVNGEREANITADFESYENLTVAFKKEGIAVSGIGQGEEGVYNVEYCYTDNTGNRTYENLKVTAAPQTIYFTVSGTVTFNGNPVAGATVSHGQESEVTDASGNYSFETEAESDISVTVSAEGYFDSGFSLSAISGNEVKNVSLIPDEILWFEPQDGATTTVSMSNKHSANGYVAEFELIEPLSCTGNAYTGITFYAGVSDTSVSDNRIYSEITDNSGILFEINKNQTGFTYLPLAYGTYGADLGENEVTATGDISAAAVPKTGGGKGIISGILSSPFQTAGKFRVTFDLVNQTFKLEKEESQEYRTRVIIEGIKKVGAGYGGINFGPMGAKIESIVYKELSGATIADTEFDKSVSAVQGALDYQGVTVASVTNIAEGTPSTYRSAQDVFKAGSQTVPKDCAAPVIALKETAVKFDVANTLSPLAYIASVTDVKDEISAESGFDTLGVEVTIYSGGTIVNDIAAAGIYTVNYFYTDTDGNIGYANLTVNAYVRAVAGLEIKGNYPTQLEKGAAFDVSGKKLVVTYNDGDREEIELLNDMIILDTSALGTKFLSLTYKGYTQTNYDSIEIVNKQIEVSGKVTYKGQGVGGVTVSYGSGQTTTDDGGNYKFKIAEGSDATVTFSKTGFIGVTEEITDIASGKTLNVTLAKPQVKISGTVTGAENVENVKVCYGSEFVYTNAQGKYEFTVEAGSAVTVTVEIEGYEKFEKQLSNVETDTSCDVALVKAEAGGCSEALDVKGSITAGLIAAACAIVLFANKKRKA